MKINIPEFEKRVQNKLIKKFVHPNGNYIGWTYTDKCQYDKIWDEYIIMARGIITTPDGEIVARPFPKFFNLGEPEAEPIPWNETIEVTEKLDGSLIVVSFYKGDMIVSSKGSFTSEYAQFASHWLIDNCLEFVVGSKLTSKTTRFTLTFLFEAIFPDKENPKVINYGDKSDLTLLAVIDTETGKNYSYKHMCDFAFCFGFPVVTSYIYDDNTISDCRKRKINEGEGLVLHFIPSDKRVKVKSEEYIKLHRLLSGCSQKNILNCIIAGEDIEQIYSRLPDESYKEVQRWVDDFRNEYNEIQLDAAKYVSKLRTMKDRKDQAKFIASNSSYSDIDTILFSILNNKGSEYTDNVIWKHIKKRRNL